MSKMNNHFTEQSIQTFYTYKPHQLLKCMTHPFCLWKMEVLLSWWRCQLLDTCMVMIVFIPIFDLLVELQHVWYLKLIVTSCFDDVKLATTTLWIMFVLGINHLFLFWHVIELRLTKSLWVLLLHFIEIMVFWINIVHVINIDTN